MIHVSSMVRATALSLLLGCRVIDEPGRGPADDRGTQIGSFGDIGQVVWSSDGNELFFVDGITHVRAVPAAGGSTRLLFSSNVSITFIVAVANRLYVSVADGDNPPTHRLLRIQPDNQHVDTILTYSGQIRRGPFAVSADERFVAFSDSLYDLVTLGQQALPAGDAWSFSPDGSHLLLRLDGSTAGIEFLIIATDDVSSQILTDPLNASTHNTLARERHYWEADDPKFLLIDWEFQKRIEASVLDARTGSRRNIATIPIEGGFSGEAAIAEDGKRAAIWEGSFTWEQLHIIDTETLAETVVATVAGSETPFVAHVVLSPDGTHAAYIVYEGGSFGSDPGVAKIYIVPTS